MELKRIDKEFSVCKARRLEDINFQDEYCFLGKTDEEISLVCSTEYVPKDCAECENGWTAFRIQGILDFSLIGILSEISKILADNHIGIFVVSTFNTDYILVKEKNWRLAVKALSEHGHTFV